MTEIIVAIVTAVLLILVIWWWHGSGTKSSSVSPGQAPDISGVWGIMQNDTFRQHVTVERIDSTRFKMTADDSHEYSVLTFDDAKHISAQPKNADGSDRSVPIRAILLNNTTLIIGGDEALGWGNGTVYHRVSFVKK